MIQVDSTSTLICTPSKCGTERMVRALVTQDGIGNSVFEKHGWKHVDGFQNYLLLVRDPLERWVSTYWWIKGTGTYQGYYNQIKDYMGSFDDFTEFVVQRKSGSYVFNTLDEYVNTFKPTKLVKIEGLCMMGGWPIDELPLESQNTYINATTHATRARKPTAETVKSRFGKAFRELLYREYRSLESIYGVPRLAK